MYVLTSHDGYYKIAADVLRAASLSSNNGHKSSRCFSRGETRFYFRASHHDNEKSARRLRGFSCFLLPRGYDNNQKSFVHSNLAPLTLKCNIYIMYTL